MLNIILADDHIVVRKGLKALLSTQPDFNVVGEAENGLEALQMVDALKPDILVLDLTMPILNGLEVTRSLSHKAGSPRVIILSMHSCEAYVNETLRSGAQAYVLKESSPEELVTAIKQVADGKRFISASLSCKFKDDTIDLEDMSTTRLAA
jgi:DNA-binding NarL/FixJ family response regulator